MLGLVGSTPTGTWAGCRESVIALPHERDSKVDRRQRAAAGGALCAVATEPRSPALLAVMLTVVLRSDHWVGRVTADITASGVQYCGTHEAYRSCAPGDYRLSLDRFAR